MPSPRQIARFITLFERVGLLYLGRFLNPKRDRAALSKTPRSRQALALFVGSYAYEYQGAPPKFARAAQVVINSGSSTPDPKLVWNAFRSQINGGTNPQHNLLYHEGASCNCVLCELRQGSKLINIVTRARRRLCKDEVAGAHQELIAIRGIGLKIASFFLRDVAMYYEIAPTSDRHLLQPVDLWVRRFVRRLDGNEELTDREVAQWVVDHATQPERANAGLWYFGAQIAPRRLVYDAALESPKHASELAERYVESLANAVRSWSVAPASDRGT